MKTFVVLSNHCDNGLQDLFLRNSDWIAENFSTVLVECAPCTLQGAEIINYFAQLCAGYGVDLLKIETKIVSAIPRIRHEDLLFLSTSIVLQRDENTFYEIAKRKLEIFNSIYPVFFYSDLNLSQLLGNFKRVIFLQTLLEKGASLQGIELIDYVPEKMTKDPRRNDSMAQQILNASTQGKNVFLDVGASHGMPLLSRLAVAGKTRGPFVRIVTEEKFGAGPMVVRYGQHTMSAKHISKVGITPAEQDALFRCCADFM